MQESEKVEAIEDKALEPTEIVELDEEVSSTEEAPIEDISKEEAVKDKEEDELVDYSKSVKKRISTLTKKMREQERAAQSAFEYAKNLQAENETLKKNSSELNKNYQSEAENRLKSQRAQANAVLKSAYQDQDWDKVTKAQDILGKINLEEGKLASSTGEPLASHPVFAFFSFFSFSTSFAICSGTTTFVIVFTHPFQQLPYFLIYVIEGIVSTTQIIVFIKAFRAI